MSQEDREREAHTTLHKLWGRDTKTKEYNKLDWATLQQYIQYLESENTKLTMRVGNLIKDLGDTLRRDARSA